MQSHTGERGAALILLIGITGALAILAAAAVMVLANQQGATASDRADKTSMDFAEAGLDSAVIAVKSKAFSTTAAFVTDTEMRVNYAAASSAAPTPYPSMTPRVYDDPVSPAVVSASTPAFDQNLDNKVWVEVEVAYQGQKTRLRQMVVQRTALTMTGLPQAALFTDGNITTSGGGDLYAVNPDGTADNTGWPYQTSIRAGGNFTSTAQTDLAAPGSSIQSLGIQYNGTLSTQGHNFTPPPQHGGVPLLSDYFTQAAQSALMFEAKAGDPTLAKSNLQGATTMSSALRTTLQLTSNQTYNQPSTDLYYNGSLTLNNSVNGGQSTFTFGSLYVTGNLTLNATRGNITVNTTALYVGGTFTINGPDGPQTFGPTYVGGDVSWSGGVVGNPLSVRTDALYVGGSGMGLFEARGVYNHVLGPMWVVGHPSTGDPAVTFAPSSPSTVLCPILATTEKIVTSGPATFGSATEPMVLYMVCDNDSLYTNTMEWGSTGTFYGLMVVMEAPVTLNGGPTYNGLPNIVGALFCSRDVSITNNTSLCYNQTIIDSVTQASLKTITTTRQTAPGTWQEVSPNSN